MDGCLSNTCRVLPIDSTAVIFQDENSNEEILNYKQFLHIADGFISELQYSISGYNSIVGIFSDCSLNLAVITYSLLQVKIPFAPLSIKCTPGYFRKCLTKCGLAVVLVQEKQMAVFNAMIEETEVLKKDQLKCVPNYFVLHLSVKEIVLTQKICYVVNSSGTTGEPKSIFVPEECIQPNVLDLRQLFSLAFNDVVLISSALTFDASLLQMFLVWSAGAAMLLVPGHMFCKSVILHQALLKHRVSILQCTSSLLLQSSPELLKKTLFGVSSPLRVIALGGEPFPNINNLLSLVGENCNINFYNIYGTTEVSSWASIHQLDLSNFLKNKTIAAIEHTDLSDCVPIGSSLTGTKLKIMKEDKEVKNGIGEIYIESVQRICFIDEEIHSGLGKTIRPTGDLGKFVNGNLYYCGRKSKSVKRNGQLVSLHLLSKVVELIENIDACFCSLSSRKELVLFIKPSATISRDFLESHIFNIIKTKLGSTYLPERVEFVDYFPITSHGKVDEPTLLQFLDNDRKFDSNPRHLLKYYWCSALNLLQPPGSGDRFVECGGDSFSAVYIINKIYAGTSYQQLFHVFMSGTYSEILSTLASLKDHTSVKFTPTHSQDMRKNEIKIAITKKEPHQHFLALLRKNEMQTCLCFPSNNKTATKITFPIKMVIAWKHSLKKCIDASPLVILDSNLSNGVVYIGSHAHLFTAVSCKTGKMLWETELGDRVESSAVVTGDGNLICVGCYDGNLYMMDRYDGTIDWIYKSGDAIKCSPAVDFTSCTVVFGSYDKHIYALDLLSKSCLWKVYFGSSCFASPLIHPENNCVYICLLSGSIFSLKLHTGDQLWQIQLDKPVFSSPSLCDTFLCVGCVDECLYAISLSGELLWKFQTNGSVFSSPVCIKIPSCTCIVFGSNDNSIYCITITGILLWKFNAEGGTCVRKLWRGHLSHALFKRHSYIWLRRRLV